MAWPVACDSSVICLGRAWFFVRRHGPVLLDDGHCTEHVGSGAGNTVVNQNAGETKQNILGFHCFQATLGVCVMQRPLRIGNTREASLFASPLG